MVSLSDTSVANAVRFDNQTESVLVVTCDADIDSIQSGQYGDLVSTDLVNNQGRSRSVYCNMNNHAIEFFMRLGFDGGAYIKSLQFTQLDSQQFSIGGVTVGDEIDLGLGMNKELFIDAANEA